MAELAKHLVGRGHDVTVFATADSTCAGTVRSRFPKRAEPVSVLSDLRHVHYAWTSIRAAQPAFDVIHSHHSIGVALAGDLAARTVLTVHHDGGKEVADFFQDFPVTYVAISKAQSRTLAPLVPQHVVYNGIDVDRHPLGDGAGGYVAFLGRLCADKAPHLAIDAARAAGVPIRIGGNLPPEGASYFEREMRPRLDEAGDAVAWLGELTHAPKVALLGGASALLMPLAWEEPFGLVMAEAMLTGTPVIAFRRGSAPEVVDEGVTGFVVRDAAEMAAAIPRAKALDRRACRERAALRFGASRMASDYERIYDAVHAKGM